MSNEIEPLTALRGDVEQGVRKRWQSLRWSAQKWLGAQLVKLLAAGGVGAGLVWVALPWFAAALCAGTVAVAVAYAVYSRRQLVHERTLRRWSWVQGKRVQQDVLNRDQSLDVATLLLVGRPEDRQLSHTARAPGLREFTAAIRYREAQTRAERTPEPTNARARQLQPAAAPSPPDVGLVRRRHEKRKSEIAKLEAEIQALATPNSIERALELEQATRSYREQSDAAHEADRVARDRGRAGRTPTVRRGETALQMSIAPNGVRGHGTTERVLAPEQIARGERSDTEPDATSGAE